VAVAAHQEVLGMAQAQLTVLAVAALVFLPHLIVVVALEPTEMQVEIQQEAIIPVGEAAALVALEAMQQQILPPMELVVLVAQDNYFLHFLLTANQVILQEAAEAQVLGMLADQEELVEVGMVALRRQLTEPQIQAVAVAVAALAKMEALAVLELSLYKMQMFRAI
jgi:hypothetical protein